MFLAIDGWKKTRVGRKLGIIIIDLTAGNIFWNEAQVFLNAVIKNVDMRGF